MDCLHVIDLKNNFNIESIEFDKDVKKPIRRCGHAVAINGNDMYLFAGEGEQSMGDFWKLDLGNLGKSNFHSNLLSSLNREFFDVFFLFLSD